MKTTTALRVLGVGLVLPLGLLGAGTPAQAAAATAVPVGAFGDAYGLLIDTTILQGNIPVKVGPLAPAASSCPPVGGTKTAQLLGGGDAQVAKVAVLNTSANADCGGKKALSSAQVTNVDALGLAAPIKIHADAITSSAGIGCATPPAGSTVVTNLTVGGTAVPLPTTIPPNTDLLPQVFGPLGLRVILNEQHPAASGRGLVVNGLHIIASNSGALPVGGAILRGDVVISHAVAGVVCPGGPGSTNGTLPKPDISFAKSASPTIAKPGTLVTYTATVTNTSATSCEVLRFIEHVAPPFDLVSSAGPLGTKLDSPAPVRTDGGVDAVLRPTAVKIDAGKSLTQTFVVRVKDSAAPGTYYDSLEIYCGLNGDFVSGPLAPVTVPGAVTRPIVKKPVTVVVGPPQLPRTGGAPLLAVGALGLLGGAYALRRRTTA